MLHLLLCALASGSTFLLDDDVDVQKATPEVYEVSFEPGRLGSKLEPTFSPYGTKLPLTAKAFPGLKGFDHLETHLKLGPGRDEDAGQLLVLARSATGKPYDLLFLDRNHDGSLDAERPVLARPSEVRGKFWSSFATAVKVKHATAREAAWEDYPLAFWVVVEKEGESPELVRFSRRGFLAGSVQIDGVAFDVVLADANNDAVFGPGDSWTIRPASQSTRWSSSRGVGDFAWAAGKAWKLELEGTSGRKGRVVHFDPGITQAEDEQQRDLLREDRLAPRAKVPVAFEHKFEQTLESAGTRKAPYFLDFETTWCGPCKQMDAFVYTAEAVAQAARGVLCIKVDGDERKDLVTRYQVKSYPTGILFDPDGKELARFVGYRGVKQMAEFFRKAAP